MSQKLRVVFPLGILCLALLIFGLVSLSARANAPAARLSEQPSAVTYTADPDELAGPAMAQETSAVFSADRESVDSDVVPQQAYRDSGYVLTDFERETVERIVMCEAGGEGERGQMMVAQCILEGMLRYGFSIDEYIDTYKVMLTSYSNVTDEVRNSVSRVFDDGARVTESKADLWYNPAITSSQWHEEQQYVTTIGSHRFFWMLDEEDDEV